MADQTHPKNKFEDYKEQPGSEEQIEEKSAEQAEQAPEQGVEKAGEGSGREKKEELAEQISEQIGESGPEKAGGGSASRQVRQKQVEDILAADLEEMYLKLAPEKQQEFKGKGEETARQINNLLDQAKVKIGKIISLIKKWLSLLPGVNRFFLEQEAKIKADKIVKLRDKKQ